MPGKFYGVGVGPGDPELLTLKAKRVLSGVDVICWPRSGKERESLAWQIASVWAAPACERLELSFPMARDREILEAAWDRAAGEVAALLQEEKQVAFITLGDPLFYSTYSYLLQALRQKLPGVVTETVPGVSSLHGCAAQLQIPLVEGEEKLAVLPAVYTVEQLSTYLELFDTLVLMKVNRILPRVIEMVDPVRWQVFLASRCGFSDGFTVREMKEVPAGRIDYMSLLIIKRRRGDRQN